MQLTDTIIISGISGQDGSYLADYALKRGFYVVGLTRDPSLRYTESIKHLEGKIELCYSSYDLLSICKLLKKYKPHSVYNFCGQSYVVKSWDIFEETIYGSALIPCHFLQAIVDIDRSIRFFQASSSEIYEVNNSLSLSEDAKVLPRNPYGCAKAMAHNMVVSFREKYNIYAVNGILFNHESPRRKDNFLSQKVVKTAVAIKHGLKDSLELGNLDIERDWSHAQDFIEAIFLMMNNKRPKDYVIASGSINKVRDLVEIVFRHLDLDYKKYVKINHSYIRSNEPISYKGNPDKIKTELNWQPKISFKQMLTEMVDIEKDKHEKRI